MTFENLRVQFETKDGTVVGVQDVSLGIKPGETVCVVGESVSGKSSAGRSILRLVEPQSGKIWLNGKDVMTFGQAQLRRARRDMQIVFQDPFASLNPQMQLVDQVAEPLKHCGLAKGADPRRRKTERDLYFKPIPSPIFPIRHEPGPSEYDEVSDGHFVLKS